MRKLVELLRLWMEDASETLDVPALLRDVHEALLGNGEIVRKVKVGAKTRLMLALGMKVKVGTFRGKGWGPLTFYLFRCPYCGRLTVDYPHGYTGYLDCYWCRKEAWGRGA